MGRREKEPGREREGRSEPEKRKREERRERVWVRDEGWGQDPVVRGSSCAVSCCISPSPTACCIPKNISTKKICHRV